MVFDHRKMRHADFNRSYKHISSNTLFSICAHAIKNPHQSKRNETWKRRIFCCFKKPQNHLSYFFFRSFRCEIHVFRLLKPNESQQNEALISAVSQILWQIGEKTKVTVVLPGDVPLIVHSHTYFQDSVTEKLYIFEFHKIDDL